MSNELPNQFDVWNSKKKELDKQDVSHLYFKQGDVWWCSLGKNIGSESCGKGTEFRRPVLVLKKLSHDSCIGIPLSIKNKQGTWFSTISLQGESRTVLLYQIRKLHTKRFQRKIAEIDEVDIDRVKQKLAALLELSVNHHPAKTRIDGNTPKT